MAVELGTGYVTMTVTAKGIAKDIGRELGQVQDHADSAGSDAGRGFSDNFGSSSESKMGGIAKGLGSLIAGGIVAAGAAAGAALAKGVADSYAAEAANDKLAAQLGLPPERAQELGQAAGALYRDAYGESLSEVNDTIKLLFQNGLIPEDATTAEIEGISSRVLDLANAFDQDLGGVTRAVSNLLRNGLAPDAETAFDIVTRGFQQGADKSEDFLDTINEYGTQFRKLGIDGVTATGLISQGLKAGARDGDKVADALKEFSIRAIDGSKLTTESFEALGLSAEEFSAAVAQGGPTAEKALGQTLDSLRAVEDPAKRAQIAVGLFGTQSEDLGDALFALDLDTAAAGMGRVEGAAAKMSDTLNNNATVKLEAFKRQALGGLADFAAKYVVPALERLGTFVTTNVVPALQTAGTWISTNLLPVLREMSDWVVTNVVPALQSFAEWLGEQVGPIVQAVGERFEAMLPHLKELARRFREDLAPQLERLVPVLQTVAEFVLQKVVPALIGLQTKIDAYVLPVLGRLITFLADIIDMNIQFITAVKNMGVAAADFVRDAKARFDEIVGFVAELPGRISSAAAGMWDGIKNSFRSALNAVIDLWNGLEFPGISVAGVQVAPGFGTPNIPRLANGGVITEPTVALLGETSRARPEIASPVSLMREVFRSELAAGGGQVVNNTFNGTNLSARDVADEIGWQMRMAGVS